MWSHNNLPYSVVYLIIDLIFLGVEKSAIEKIVDKKKPREIVHGNTRFDSSANTSILVTKSSTPSADHFLIKQGKIGVDGKEVLPAPSPRVGGYGFVATPSPMPGKFPLSSHFFSIL